MAGSSPVIDDSLGLAAEDELDVIFIVAILVLVIFLLYTAVLRVLCSHGSRRINAVRGERAVVSARRSSRQTVTHAAMEAETVDSGFAASTL